MNIKKNWLKNILLPALVIVLINTFSGYSQEESLGDSKSNIAGAFSECTGAGQLIYDDGVFENGYGFNPSVSDGRIVMLFTPQEYPWQFNTMCIGLARLATAGATLNFDIVVYDNTGTGGSPGNIIVVIRGLAADNIPVWSTISWYDYDISSVPVLTGGSYYIGAKWDASQHTGLIGIVADQSPTTPLRPGYRQSNGGNWDPLELGAPNYRAMGIRTLGNIASTTAVQIFFDDFESNTDSLPAGWTVVNDGGTGVWGVYPNPGQTSWPNLYTLPCGTGCGKVLAADSDHWNSGSTLLSTATINQTFDAALFGSVWLRFDNDFRHLDPDDHSFVEVSTDSGSNWTIVWSVIGISKRNTHEIVNISSLAAGETFQVRFRSVQPGWDLWWAVDNVAIYFDDFIPVELISFSATILNEGVELSWATATEVNNRGFEIERTTSPRPSPYEGEGGTPWEKIGFVEGFGTTTETKSYSFTDNDVVSGNYKYRLKQIDFDGSFEYSNIIEVEVDFMPKEFVLEQNYPNPFNPATVIRYQLPVNSSVKIEVFNMLGQRLGELVNSVQDAGYHNLSWDGSDVSSGIYFYSIQAKSLENEKSYSSVRKMVLLK